MITATVSHEMRTPINAMLLEVDNALNLQKNKNSRMNKKLTIIKNSAKALLYLVNDLLDVFMIKNGKFNVQEDIFMI